MFGSVGSKEIADALNAQLSIQADKKKISIEPIKTLGEYEAVIKLYPSVNAKIKVIVKGE